MHPYQMLRLLRKGHRDDLPGLKGGSLYHAINRLESADPIALIAADLVDREARRPERTTYQFKGKGEQKLVNWLREGIADVHPDSGDRVALSHGWTSWGRSS